MHNLLKNLQRGSGLWGYYCPRDSKNLFFTAVVTAQDIGDVHTILVDSLDCENVFLIEEEPIIFENEKSTLDTANIVGIWRGGYPTVDFEYSVHNINYRKVQNFKNRKEIKSVKKGDKYLIRYVDAKPTRAILYIDRKVA